MEIKDIFLSHSSVDRGWVETLGSRLEQEEHNGKSLSVFLDKWDIQPGDNLVYKLNEGLEKSRKLCIIMTPEMLISDWCKLEVSAFISADPVNRNRRIIPILLRDRHLITGERIAIPPILSSLLWLDFRNEKDFDKEFRRLLAVVRGEPPPRGATQSAQKRRTIEPIQNSAAIERHTADSVTETLIGNILKTTPPDYVWSANTGLKSKKDLHEFYRYPAQIVRENKLFTFEDLSKSGHCFSNVVRGDKYEKTLLSDWFSDLSKWRWGVELLNDTLRRYLWQKGIGFHPKSERYYFKPQGDTSVYVKWGSGDRRCVVRVPETDQPNGNWVHQAARLYFEKFDSDIYLSIEPSWMFTINGRESVSRYNAGPLAMQWGGKERNGTILRHTLMWSDAITSGQKFAEIPAGSQKLKIDRLPPIAKTNVGILEDKVAMRALLEFTEVEQNLKEVTNTNFRFLTGVDTKNNSDEAEESDS